jgi:hypothetical protein
VPTPSARPDGPHPPSDHHAHRPGRGTELKPEQLPTDSTPAPPWPWAEGANLPTGNEQPSSRPSHGQEMLQALQAQSRANQAPTWTRPPRRWSVSLRPRPLVITSCLALAAVGVAVPLLVSHSASSSVPPPAAGVHPSAPLNPATPAASPVTPTPTDLPTPVPATPQPAAIPTPTAPGPAANDATAPLPAAVPAPPATDQTTTRRRSPSAHPAPAHPPAPANQPPNDPGPQWADDTQPEPASPPCTSDCTQPTLTRTPNHWSPNTP